MSLDFLKSKKAPFPLRIREMDLLNIAPELKKKLELPSNLFEIDRTRNQLEQKEIFVPVFEVNKMFPIQYEQKRNGEVIGSYPSFANFIDFEVTYRKGNLLKIIHKKGVKVLKPTDEKFTSEIIEEKIEYHFQFDFEENRWKFIQDIPIFEKLKEELEDNIKSEEVLNLIDEFFNLIDTYHSNLLKTNAVNASGVPEKIKGYFKTTIAYLEFQNIVGALEDINLELIKTKINQLEIAVGENEKQIGKISDYKIRDNFSTIISRIHELFTLEGYWIIDNDIYPSIGAFHSSMQKASYNRTPQYKRNLKKALLAWHQKFHPKNYVTNVHEASFAKYLKEVKN